jgi:hypothetical protein
MVSIVARRLVDQLGALACLRLILGEDAKVARSSCSASRMILWDLAESHVRQLHTSRWRKDSRHMPVVLGVNINPWSPARRCDRTRFVIDA